MNTSLKIKLWLIFFITGLFLSGVTAFPLAAEVKILNNLFGHNTYVAQHFPNFSFWITHIFNGVTETSAKYPFIFYGTDWLAFAHIMLAILFIGPFRDPVKNIWIIKFGIIACVLVVPFAFICGPIRGIPFYWTLIDCSFGVIGVIPLLMVRKLIKSLPTN